MDKLLQIASHYGLDVEGQEEGREAHEKLAKELATLEKQKRIVLTAVDN
jgi:hypothetical protein